MAGYAYKLLNIQYEIYDENMIVFGLVLPCVTDPHVFLERQLIFPPSRSHPSLRPSICTEPLLLCNWLCPFVRAAPLLNFCGSGVHPSSYNRSTLSARFSIHNFRCSVSFFWFRGMIGFDRALDIAIDSESDGWVFLIRSTQKMQTSIVDVDCGSLPGYVALQGTECGPF